MAKHKKYSRKRRGQKRRNKTRSIKTRGGSDDEQYRYESPPPLNINDLNDSSQETTSYIPDSNVFQGSPSSQDFSQNLSQDTQDFSQDTQGFSQGSQGFSQDELTLPDLDTTEHKKRTYDVSFQSQDPAEPKRSKLDTKEILRYGDESDIDEEENSDDEQDAYQSDNEYEFSDNELGGGRKRKRRKTNKRKRRKTKKTRKHKKRRQRGGIIL
jgi:hypothetical protein